MDGTPVGTDGVAGGARRLDVDGEFAVLEACLEGLKHPVPRLLRKQVLELATGISARAAAPACTDEVNARLRAVLRRHGIFCNDLRPR